ncbi:MAG TPA: sigma-70 family RNA polymerase sigma factor [Baekduia sp.]|uniref:RNA polymerase sigma factor n=1 Tax=Baekduia sp. TaxID=2600305 RepID=UPI002D76A1B7|nr:sigma-70 family RNA polymerase sigma factor [Baekduia sp.]HET6506918.1 sigma-70 family RNA polymerase sigma factor [Baekduia sp.]
MEVSALRHSPAAGLRGPTPLLRLQGDERLVVLTRRGNQAAYEALVSRYQARLLAFCRHMLASREDAEDVLQEVFAAAFNAMMADDRPINVRPWLYRIARNRCLNHLRKQTAIGMDSMDVHLAEHGTTTADKVHDREDFRQLVADVQTLAETQRTALLLREIDALSYEQIAEAMETTVPSVKSLLVRARVSLAEAAEARKLTCTEVREELGEWAEGLTKVSAPVRRHVRGCQRCADFKKQLKSNNKALAAVFPIGPLLLFKKFLLAQGAGSAAAGAGSAAAGAGGVAASGVTTGGALSAGVGAVATKAAAGLAAVAIVTTGAVEVDHAKKHRLQQPAAEAAKPVTRAAAPVVPATPAPVAVKSVPQTAPAHTSVKHGGAEKVEHRAKPTDAAPATTSAAPSTAAPASTQTATASVPASTTAPAGTQQGYDNTRLPDQTATAPAAPTTVTPAATTPAEQPTATSTPPADTTTTTPPASTTTPAPADPAPPADDPTTTTPDADDTTTTTPSGGASSTTPAG